MLHNIYDTWVLCYIKHHMIYTKVTKKIKFLKTFMHICKFWYKQISTLKMVKNRKHKIEEMQSVESFVILVPLCQTFLCSHFLCRLSCFLQTFCTMSHNWLKLLEFVKLTHCFCIKRTLKVNVTVDPSAIWFISLGSKKKVYIIIRGNVNYN